MLITLEGGDPLTHHDVYIDGRPIESRDINDGTHTFVVEVPSGGNLLELAGYDDGDFVASRKLEL